ncbi:diguanylate cyclase domain-containing protein, partial [Magnetococcales bacterium HHB-1]
KAARKMAFDYNILDRFQVMRHGIFLGIEGVNDLATMAERIDHLDVEVLQRYSESLLDHQQGAAFFSWVSEEEVVSKGRLALPVQKMISTDGQPLWISWLSWMHHLFEKEGEHPPQFSEASLQVLLRAIAKAKERNYTTVSSGISLLFSKDQSSQIHSESKDSWVFFVRSISRAPDVARRHFIVAGFNVGRWARAANTLFTPQGLDYWVTDLSQQKRRSLYFHPSRVRGKQAILPQDALNQAIHQGLLWADHALVVGDQRWGVRFWQAVKKPTVFEETGLRPVLILWVGLLFSLLFAFYVVRLRTLMAAHIKTLDALTESDERFKSVTNSTSDAIVSLNRDGEILFWNLSAEEIFNLPLEKALDQKITALFIDRKNKLMRAIQKLTDPLVKSRKDKHVVLCQALKTVSGQQVTFPVEVVLTRQVGGRFHRVTGIIRDITEQQAQEAREMRTYQSRIAISALLETALESLTMERQLEVALDIILTVPWLAVKSKGIVFLKGSDGCLRMAAQRRIEAELKTRCAVVEPGVCICGIVLQQNRTVFTSHVDHQHTVTHDQMEDHGHYGIPIRVREEVVGVLTLYLSAGHVKDPEEEAFLGTVAHTLAGLIEQRKTEKALLLEHRFRESILETTAALVIVLDLEGRIIYFNRACQQLTGYRMEEVKNRFIWDKLLPSEDVEQVSTVFRELRDARQFKNSFENHWQAKDGTRYFIAWRNSIVLNADGSVRNILGTGIDMTKRRKAEERLRKLAHQDALTGLPNRAMFQELLVRELARTRRQRRQLAVMFIDLDRFKAVNDTLGHEAGDEVLKTVALRAKECLRQGDVIARLGGDEFTVMLSEVTDERQKSDIKHVAERLVSRLSAPFIINGQSVSIGASIGICLCPEHGDELDLLLKRADRAMYAVKAAGRNGYRFFHPGLEDKEG